MATPDREIMGRLDGRDPDSPNYLPRDWTGVTLYGPWDFGMNLSTRRSGADAGKQPGDLWWTPSDLDHTTVLAEILTKRFRGKYTVMHMLSALFCVDVLGEDPDDVRKLLGL